MDLLPKNHSEFRQKEYWDEFFRKRGSKAFEWYGEYGELCSILHKYIKNTDNILHVGTGNSKLPADLHQVGYTQQKCIDLSDQAIRQMRTQYPHLSYEKMDATSMTFTDDTFNVVLDKGTLDAMMPDESQEVVANVSRMFSEIERVLKQAGRYICVSLLQPHILNHLVEWFSDRGWPVRVLRCPEAEAARPPEDRVFPVFVVVATKFRKLNNTKPVLEMSLSSSGGHLTRLKTPAELIGSVRGIQQFAAVRAGAAKGQLFQGTDARQTDVSLDLLVPGSPHPKYSFYLVDRDRPSTQEYAVFIVPQGREAEWLFSTREGRLQLAESAQCRRLCVVHLDREHHYGHLDHIKDELSGYVMELSPHDMSPTYQVPFLSLGGEVDDMSSRHEKCRGKSDISGEFVVEDVTVNGQVYRRLIFFNNPKLIQSEARVMNVKGKKKKKVDTTYLACAHHSVMMGSLGFFLHHHHHHNKEIVRGLIVGLGGGGLPTYITTHFDKVYLDVVEIDESIVRVAQDQFGFVPGERLNVITADGLKYIEDTAAKIKSDTEAQQHRYNVIMFDVDSKDMHVGMSSPPKPFVQPEFLSTVKQCLHTHGMFVLNLSCRDPLLRSEVIQDIHKVFVSVLSYKLPEEVNEILFCTDAHSLVGKPLNRHHPALEAFARVNTATAVTSNQKSCHARNEEALLDLADCVKQLKIV